MAATYAGTTAFTLQSGAESETSPEGLVTLTESFKGSAAGAAAFVTANPRGTAPLTSGYASLVSISSPRVAFEGAYATAYIVYQGTPSGDGTIESDLDINHSDEERTVKIKQSEEDTSTHYLITYIAPTITASYVVGSKPNAFRFDGLIGSEEPVFVSSSPKKPGGFVEDVEIKIKTTSKFTERRNKGGIWFCTEQHARIITNLDGTE